VTFKFQGKYKPEKESWGCGSISPSRRLESVPTTGPSQVPKTVPDGAVPIYRPSEVYEQSPQAGVALSIDAKGTAGLRRGLQISLES
jgi:hypothetical protein